MSTHDRQSHLTVALTRGQSRITSWRSVNPLRLLNPRHDGLCHVMVSSYGGGLVQGDDVSLDVRCEQSAALLLSGQSHGRAYRCTQEDATVSWQTTGTVAEGATVISQMPPLVLHSATRAAQRQSWQVHPEGRLLLIETVHAGRLGSGEAFAFDRFESHVEIQRGATQVVWDPQALPADTPRAFRFPVLQTIYAIGWPDSLQETLATEIKRVGGNPPSGRVAEMPEVLAASFDLPAGGFIGRLVANSAKPAEEIAEALAQASKELVPA